MEAGLMTQLEKEKLTLYASAILHVATHEKPEVNSPDAMRIIDIATDRLMDIACSLMNRSDCKGATMGLTFDWCCSCSKWRMCKKTGEYTYEGKVCDIMVCQWCRAAETRRKRQKNEKNIKKKRN